MALWMMNEAYAYPIILVALVLLPAAYFFSLYRSLTRHIAAAKRSGIQYVVVPVFMYNMLWLLTSGFVLPYLRMLPTSWSDPWLKLITPGWLWKEKYGIFERLGTETLITVAPGGLCLWTCDPEVISQMNTRRQDFQKPTHAYRLVEVYGPNVVSTEGAVWRHHRRITAVPFTEKNNASVWAESIDQAREMIGAWRSLESQGAIPDLAADTMMLTLHIISMAGFGKKLAWSRPGSADVTTKTSSSEVPLGHTLSYRDALSGLLENLWIVLITPHSLLRLAAKVVGGRPRRAWMAFLEWRQYMNAMYMAKKEEVQHDYPGAGLDLMGALVRGAGITRDTSPADAAGWEKGTDRSGQLLSNDEILGNAFVFLFAGHETTAGVLRMTLLSLACNPSSQLRLQQDLDQIFGQRPITEWHYDKDILRLLGGMAGAVMNETLRLYPPIMGIPKSTRQHEQPLSVDGRRVVVPAHTSIRLDAVGAQRNPRIWPRGPSPPSATLSSEEDLARFAPERWFVDAAHAAPETPMANSPTDVDGADAPEIPHTLFRPPRGAFMAFSEGPRACLGRRFAQVEILAVIAVIFRDYSIELAVDDFATPSELANMPMAGRQRLAAWEKARARADDMMRNNMKQRLTLQLVGRVPLRIVPRGQEQFMHVA
ncbi:MAG: hypothetical protein M1838_001394 [Thelocarpon superellum]|nr:MAG: hypothetical protein M1838_001394 [Thelocarpon superellum]